MANPNRARKLLVRTAIVTTATSAALFGAQNIAMLDTKYFQPTTTPVFTVASADFSNNAQIQGIANITIQPSTSNVSILRQPVANTHNNQLASSVQISAPQPVVIQQPVRQVTQSSK